MSYHEAKKIRRKLVPFMTLVLSVACILLLSSCGGGENLSTTEKPIPKVLTTQEKLGIGVSSDSAAITNSIAIKNNINVAGQTISVRLINGFEKKEVGDYLDSQDFLLVSANGRFIQINPNLQKSQGEIDKIIRLLKSQRFVEDAYQPIVVGDNSIVVSEENDSWLHIGELNASQRWNHNAIRLNAAWDGVYGDNNGIDKSASVNIGVIERAVGGANNHPDINISSITPLQVNAAPSIGQHAYHVSGIIGATANNNRGIAGAVIGNALLNLDATIGTAENITFHINRQLDGSIRVINISLGYRRNVAGETPPVRQDVIDLWSKESHGIFENLLPKLESKDALLIIASGNRGNEPFSDGEAFASEYSMAILYAINEDNFLEKSNKELARQLRAHVLVVGSFYDAQQQNRRDEGSLLALSGFTNLPIKGANDDSFILAPGGSDSCDAATYGSAIYSLKDENNKWYGWDCGTSMAAPHVTGVSALVMQAKPSYAARDIKRSIIESADIGRDGYRYLRADKAVDFAKNHPSSKVIAIKSNSPLVPNQNSQLRITSGSIIVGDVGLKLTGASCEEKATPLSSMEYAISCTPLIAGDQRIIVYYYKTGEQIDVLSEYRTIRIHSPVIAPLAPALSEPTSGTIRLNWGAVTGATGYEISRTGQTLTTVGAVSSYDDTGRTPGTMYCYRVRTIQNGTMSAYSPESCLTVNTLKCQGTWTASKYNTGQAESRTLACPSGQTGNISQTHTCQATGQWGQTSEINTCTVAPVASCTGSWSSAKYLIGQTEEKYENTCPAGTQGQVRSWHTCQASGTSAVWGGLAQSDNCTAYLDTPKDVYASSVNGGVQITWSGVSGATSYKLYKNDALYRSDVVSTSFVDQYVTNGSTYRYSVAAYSSLNGGSVTSPISGNYSVVYRDGQIGVNPPTGVSASKYTQYSQKGIRLTWTGATNADSYLIYRRGYSNPYASATFLAPVGGGDISFNDWVNQGFTGSIVSGQSYCYYIRSIRGSANSTESNEACSIAP